MRAGDLPFPDPEPAATSETLLRKEVAQRFGTSGTYRDVPFAVMFVLHLLLIVVVALVNGLAAADADDGHAAPPSPPSQSDLRRSHELLLMLTVAAVCSGLLTAVWLALLRAGARKFIYAGAVGGCVVGLANACWLLAQGNAAGVTLGLSCLVLTVACVVFLTTNRHRIEFSVTLLSTVATLLREYPTTLAAAAAGWVLHLLWVVLWSTAFSFTSLQPKQAAVLFLLLLSFLWTTQLIKAVLHCSVAGTVAAWYFLSPNVPRRPTSRALRRALTTSFGSLCLGALVASSLKALRAVTRLAFVSPAGGRSGSAEMVRSCCLCLLGFLDVLVRYFNEYAYTQVAMYGKSFTTASRHTWTLLMHSSTGVDYLMQRDLVGTALAFGAIFSGLLAALVTGLWARAALGDQQPQWWQAIVAAFLIGHGSVSLVSSVVESGVCALYVCFAEDPTPLAVIDPQLNLLFSTAPPGDKPAAPLPPADYHEAGPAHTHMVAFSSDAYAAPRSPTDDDAVHEGRADEYALAEAPATHDAYTAFPLPAASVTLAAAFAATPRASDETAPAKEGP